MVKSLNNLFGSTFLIVATRHKDLLSLVDVYIYEHWIEIIDIVIYDFLGYEFWGHLVNQDFEFL